MGWLDWLFKPAAVPPGPAWPEGAREFPRPGSGVWYVGSDGPFASPSEYYDYLRRARERDQNLSQWEQQQQVASYTGRWPADSLTDDEAALVFAYTHRQPGTELAGQVYYRANLFSGDNAAISRLVNRGERVFVESHKSAWQTVAEAPDSDLKRALAAL